jgi:hypothetical protein
MLELLLGLLLELLLELLLVGAGVEVLLMIVYTANMY